MCHHLASTLALRIASMALRSSLKKQDSGGGVAKLLYSGPKRVTFIVSEDKDKNEAAACKSVCAHWSYCMVFIWWVGEYGDSNRYVFSAVSIRVFILTAVLHLCMCLRTFWYALGIHFFLAVHGFFAETSRGSRWFFSVGLLWSPSR